MTNGWRHELQTIYNALADDKSRKIFRRRLLYSLLGEKEEITELIFEYSPACGRLKGKKVCFYGAGGGAAWLLHYNRRIPFIVDKYKKGVLDGRPILSLDEFLQKPDAKEYLFIITVGKPDLRKQIEQELDGYGLSYVFGYFDLQYFDLQYFDLQNEAFVDAGALDGNTTKYFLDHFKGGSAYVFEPNPKQLAVVKKCLGGYSGVSFFPYGLYDENKTMYFDPCDGDEGSARLAENGDQKVEVRRLDDVLRGQRVTFIKMDIEGAELAALRGAEEIIRGQKPKLAICVYHKPEDLWEIPRLILEYCPQYKLYLRHYSITHTETVLYAVL